MTLMKWKNEYLLLGLLSRCYKFKRKAKCSLTMYAERNCMHHKRRLKWSDEAELAYLSVSATYQEFKKKKAGSNVMNKAGVR